MSLTTAVQCIGSLPNSLHTWSLRFFAEGRDGLVDRRRNGRPSKPDDAVGEPLEYDYPVTTWTVTDLTDLLGRRGWPVSTSTIYRAWHAMGYHHRRPRHDLTHRQEAEPVASAKHVLAEPHKYRGWIPAGLRGRMRPPHPFPTGAGLATSGLPHDRAGGG